MGGGGGGSFGSNILKGIKYQIFLPLVTLFFFWQLSATEKGNNIFHDAFSLTKNSVTWVLTPSLIYFFLKEDETSQPTS